MSKKRVQGKIKVGLPLTTHTTKLGYKLLHGNLLSVSYSPQARIRLHWVRLAGTAAWLVVVAAPYKYLQVAPGFIIFFGYFAIEVSYQIYCHFACVQQIHPWM